VEVIHSNLAIPDSEIDKVKQLLPRNEDLETLKIIAQLSKKILKKSTGKPIKSGALGSVLPVVDQAYHDNIIAKYTGRAQTKELATAMTVEVHAWANIFGLIIEYNHLLLVEVLSTNLKETKSH
jgi:hypothetical protein